MVAELRRYTNEEGALLYPIGETKQRLAKHWSDITLHLSDEYNPHYKSFIRDYFRAQVRIEEGNRKKAGRILSGLDKRPGYMEFEAKNEHLLAAIDIAVHGNTNRVNELGEPVKPSFEVIG